MDGGSNWFKKKKGKNGSRIEIVLVRIFFSKIDLESFSKVKLRMIVI